MGKVGDQMAQKPVNTISAEQVLRDNSLAGSGVGHGESTPAESGADKSSDYKKINEKDSGGGKLVTHTFDAVKATI